MLCLPSLAHQLFDSKRLGFSDTDEDKIQKWASVALNLVFEDVKDVLQLSRFCAHNGSG